MSGGDKKRQPRKGIPIAQNPDDWQTGDPENNSYGTLREESKTFIAGVQAKAKSKGPSRILGVEEWRGHDARTGKLVTHRFIDMRGKNVGKALSAVFQFNIDEARAENLRVLGVPDVAPKR
jgi:DNA-nicking Smr family endonuclease